MSDSVEMMENFVSPIQQAGEQYTSFYMIPYLFIYFM